MTRSLLLLGLASCTGSVNQQVDFSKLDDLDQDGHSAETDCDDRDPTVHPDADEACDGLDNDCDGFIDAADDNAIGLLTGFTDDDGDGYGSPDSQFTDCELSSGTVATGGDCDDTNASVNPEGTETCSTTADDDCDGTVNDPDAEGCSDWYIDQDEDGHGAGEPTCLCFSEGDTTSASGDDCDDEDPETHPGATEVCDDGWDQDCDEGAAACRLEGELGVESAPLYLQGMSEGGLLGTRLGSSQDLDGDHQDDLLILGVSDDEILWVVQGTGSGDEGLDSPSFVLEASSDVTQVNHAFGRDIDGDGLPDLVIGAQEANGNAGTTALFLGPLDGRGQTDTAWARWDGSSGSESGVVAWAGDLLGDGSPLFMVGAPGESAIHIISATSGGAFSLSDNEWQINGDAQQLASAGDVDGDGLDDILVGHPASSGGGEVYLVSGPGSTTHLEDASATILAESSTDLLGSALAAAGDVDGDGLADVLIGAPGHASEGTQAGVAYLFLGPIEGELTASDATARIDGEAAKDQAGTAVCSPGDMDHDGFNEIAVGAPDNDEGASSAGMVGVFYGPISGAHSVHRGDAMIIGESPDDRVGQTLLGGTDIDGNGRPDLILGVPGEDDGLQDGGGAAVWSGLGY